MKQAIRERIKSLRNSQKGSNRIIKQLLERPEFLTSRSVLLYMPINNEVDTEPLLTTNKELALPVIRDNKIIISKFGKLVTGMYNVPEPVNVQEINSNDIDLVIIPGLAFDRKGSRIGYGKGYYDKLLAKITAPKIALAYSYQITEEIPRESHDIPMDMIITEEEVIICD